jgi:hypothetical protein
MGLTILKTGDSRGVGAIVQETRFFGLLKRRWTVRRRDADDTDLKTWICIETGTNKLAFFDGEELENFYQANYAMQGEKP